MTTIMVPSIRIRKGSKFKTNYIYVSIIESKYLPYTTYYLSNCLVHLRLYRVLFCSLLPFNSPLNTLLTLVVVCAPASLLPGNQES